MTSILIWAKGTGDFHCSFINFPSFVLMN